METRSGIQVFPEKPDLSVISITDIAGSLANQCRYNGHTSSFFSVAEHSTLLAVWVNRQYHDATLTFQALMHDAAETYLGDLIRPLKYGMFRKSRYMELDEEWTMVIMEKYGLPPKIHVAIKEADLGMLRLERDQLFKPTGRIWDYQLPGVTIPNIEGKIRCSCPEEAERVFLTAFDDYLFAFDRSRGQGAKPSGITWP